MLKHIYLKNSNQIKFLKITEGAYSFWRSHSLRAYFISTFINKTGQKTLADYLAGHRISEQDRSYWKANPKDLEKHYLKVFYLTLDQARVKDVKSEEYKEIKKENKMLRAQIQELTGRIDMVEESVEEREVSIKTLKDLVKSNEN